MTSPSTPLLSPPPRRDPTATPTTVDEAPLQFYDPSAILSLPRDVALGYLILLTGGNLDLAEASWKDARRHDHDEEDNDDDEGYVAPNPIGNNDDDDVRPATSKPPSTMTSYLDESTASLAYAAIVDGNVLPACFGLKTWTSKSSSSSPSSSSPSSPSSLWCKWRWRASRRRAAKLPSQSQGDNSTEMRRTAEALRDIRDGNGSDSSLHLRVVRAYVRCFAAVVRYRDRLQQQQKGQPRRAILSKSKRSVLEMLWCCLPFPRFAAKNAHGDNYEDVDDDESEENDNDDDVKRVSSTSLEQTTLQQIQMGFRGLGPAIVKALDAVEGSTDLASGVSF